MAPLFQHLSLSAVMRESPAVRPVTVWPLRLSNRGTDRWLESGAFTPPRRIRDPRTWRSASIHRRGGSRVLREGGVPTAGDYVLFGMDVPRGPRQDSAEWRGESAPTIILGQVTSDLYTGTAPHWPDEVSDASSQVPPPVRLRPDRLGKGVSLSPANGPLDAATTEVLRKSGRATPPISAPMRASRHSSPRLTVTVDPGTGQPGMVSADSVTQEEAG